VVRAIRTFSAGHLIVESLFYGLVVESLLLMFQAQECCWRTKLHDD